MAAPGGQRFAGFLVSLGATLLVVVFPCALALILRLNDVVTSPVLLILISVALSVCLSLAVSAVWKRWSGANEVLFEDLMIWGWLRHRRFERLLTRTETFVGPDVMSGLSPADRAKQLERLSEALEARDPGTLGHSRRVARHAANLAKRLKLPPEEIARIRTAALLHDVGKIETPREIIDKPARLTEEELEVIKLHPGAGAAMVAGLGDPELTAMVRHHHEQIDGGGYPDGIAGEEIPLGARIIAVADTFDALTSARPYRRAMSHERALEILAAEAGRQLDPEAVAAFEAQYGGHRPAAAYAALLGIARQAGQVLAGVGSGATQVAAVGAAVTVLGTVPVKRTPPPDPVASGAGDPTSRTAPVTADVVASPTSGGSTTGGAGATDGRRNDPGSKAGEGVGPQVNAPGNNSESGSRPDDGSDGDGGSGGSEGGSGGDDSGSEGGGGGGSGGDVPLPEVPEKVPPVIPPPVQEVIDKVPAVPEQVPGSGAINEVVGGVKELPGKTLGGK